MLLQLLLLLILRRMLLMKMMRIGDASDENLATCCRRSNSHIAM